MNEYIKELEKIVQQYSDAELEQICKGLNKSYNIYDSEEYRWSQLKYVLSKTTEEDIKDLKSTQLSNRIINDLILKFYPCERVVKYYLIKKLRALSNHIVAFEMSIGKSRIDICRINGSSYAYEIKTEYDTFDRLETQMHDYMETFEKVYLVVPLHLKQSAMQHIPDACGVITYRSDKDGALSFNYYRKATFNSCNMQKCANSLSSTELTSLLKLLGCSHIPSLKEDKLNELNNYRKVDFWKAYKELLKEKYLLKWDFLVNHFDDILPIDVQNFFSTSLDPTLAYYTTKAGQS